MQIIKNLKDWEKYKKYQDNRVAPLEAHHNPSTPPEYPIGVISTLLSGGHTYTITNHFITIKEAKALIAAK